MSNGTNNKCFTCDKTWHFAKYCKENKIDFKKYIPDEYDRVICAKLDDKLKIKEEDIEKKDRDPRMSYMEFDGKELKIIYGSE